MKHRDPRDPPPMYFQKQAFRHDPAEGQFGDCYRTCIAVLLGIDKHEVPNFGVHYDDNAAFFAASAEWLATRGLTAWRTAYIGTLEEVLAAIHSLNPGYVYMLTGVSRSGCHHVVLCQDKRILWDTSTNGAGIVGPCDDGLFHIEVLVPVQGTTVQLKGVAQGDINPS